MKNLLEPTPYQEILQRIELLQPHSARLWGKMSVAQMLAHCQVPIQVALGDVRSTRSWLGYLLGPLVRSMLTSDKPLSAGSPTDAHFIVKEERNFEMEREKLKNLIHRLHTADTKDMTGRIHPFFGRLTAEQWGKGTYKHLDHHLRQFGV
ncbi:MAG TPA: hypothetical protein DCM08_08150 [Microscillaceae bacterium]|nr:hypothetical protein [Microscillaceae bacterium]